MRLPLDLLTLKAFSDEFTKISMDAGCRATQAGKTGKAKDYLVGGELSSNSPGETNFEPKIATLREQAGQAYDKAREPAMAALKGAGGSILLGQVITGGGLGNHSGIARLGFRGAAALGAGVGLADHYLTKKKAVMPSSPAMAKVANFDSASFTPGRELSEGVQTGSFKKMVHQGGRLRPPKVGQKFTVPGVPGEPQ